MATCNKMTSVYVAKHSLYASFLALDEARRRCGKDFPELNDLCMRLLSVYNDMALVASSFN